MLPFSFKTILLSIGVSATLRELQMLYAKGDLGCYYIIPDDRKCTSSDSYHGRELCNNVKLTDRATKDSSMFLSHFPWILSDAEEAFSPVSKARILKLDDNGFTQEFTADVKDGDGRCLQQVRYAGENPAKHDMEVQYMNQDVREVCQSLEILPYYMGHDRGIIFKTGTYEGGKVGEFKITLYVGATLEKMKYTTVIINNDIRIYGIDFFAAKDRVLAKVHVKKGDYWRAINVILKPSFGNKVSRSLGGLLSNKVDHRGRSRLTTLEAWDGGSHKSVNVNDFGEIMKSPFTKTTF